MNDQGSRLPSWVGLSNNPLTLAGVVLVTTAGILWLFSIAADVGSGVTNPYVGILSVLILPALFLLGLILMPLGVWMKYRSDQRAGRPAPLTALHWRDPVVRKLALFIGIATVANLIIGASFVSSGVHYMGTVEFCGTACHVMNPEWTAYQAAAHSEVDCVRCHVGLGAKGFVRSKIQGAGQLIALVANTYERPITTPVESLADPKETCESCHARNRNTGNGLRVFRHFSDDAQNTPSTTVLLVRIGGGTANGIHGAHLKPGRRIEYLSDPKREEISRIRVVDDARKLVEYSAGEAAGEKWRVMDCTDCHNRPAHTFRLPEEAVDAAIAAGEIDRSLPFVRKQGVELLQKEYGSAREAHEKLPAQLKSFYAENHPEVASSQSAAIENAAQELVDIWSRNVFPEMNVTWGTYPNQIGHQNWPGCFRCHDDSHQTADGKAISQDCSLCHEMVAMEEESPEVLTTLGLAR